MRLGHVIWSTVLSLVYAAAYAQPPVEHFARLPAAKGLSISPDGTRVAFLAHDEDNTLLVVEDLETGEFGNVLFNDERYDFSSVRMDRHLGHVAGVVIERERGETLD